MLAALWTLSAATPLGAQARQRQGSRFSPALASRPPVREALRWLDANFDRQVAEWIRLTEIPAPSRYEQARAAYVRAEFEREGLSVNVDSIGNVVARRPGSGAPGAPTIVFAAHLDTVHPDGTDVTVRRAGDTLRAPGVFDNSASLANMLAVVRALNHARVRTAGDLVFIGTAQEELGLRGMDYWLTQNPDGADMLVALDGGLGPVLYGALGIYWTRYYFRGDGSHTNTSAGKPHPAVALADAIRSIYEIRVPESAAGGGVYNVGMLAGGKIFNAIPEEVSFTVDLRSVNPALLDSLDGEIEQRVARAAAVHRVRWAKERVTANRAGGTADMLRDRLAHPLVQTALHIQRHLGVSRPGNPEALATGSTDANTGVVRGIPAIALGRSFGGNQHTLLEFADVPSALIATKAALLLAVSLAGVR